jgi:hypothetical protein
MFISYLCTTFQIFSHSDLSSISIRQKTK